MMAYARVSKENAVRERPRADRARRTAEMGWKTAEWEALRRLTYDQLRNLHYGPAYDDSYAEAFGKRVF